jgi:hypothetical protein
LLPLAGFAIFAPFIGSASLDASDFGLLGGVLLGIVVLLTILAPGISRKPSA